MSFSDFLISSKMWTHCHTGKGLDSSECLKGRNTTGVRYIVDVRCKSLLRSSIDRLFTFF
jgi:hypothetical protein